ncbi:MAG TPA: succinate dehydrogenase cytochrome b558 subunit [Pirellulaceae bacterium]|nr:succinate dehydrogenase cytochrome b558 subunit [Pirellulaceae bacterium]
MEKSSPASSFLARHEFLLRRLHSLSGLIPVGAYMCVHLITNASVLNSPATFQNAVYGIHSLGKILPIVEWVFIFIPILFHAIFGVIIIRSGLPNHSSYRYTNNLRYTLQRATGMIAFAFIMWHVFHMHGWFHFDAWLNGVAKPLGGAEFSPYNATSTAGEALQASFIVQLLYAVGILSCVFHLANGIWTMGITWGLWVTPAAQRYANWVSVVFGVVLGAIGLSALGGMMTVDTAKAKAEEDRMYEARVESGYVEPNEHKRTHEPKTAVADPSVEK